MIKTFVCIDVKAEISVTLLGDRDALSKTVGLLMVGQVPDGTGELMAAVKGASRGCVVVA